jgi:hypothetical protein
MWVFFSLALVGVAVAILLLLRRYAAPSVTLVVKGMTSYSWLVAFIVLVRPGLAPACLAGRPLHAERHSRGGALHATVRQRPVCGLPPPPGPSAPCTDSSPNKTTPGACPHRRVWHPDKGAQQPGPQRHVAGAQPRVDAPAAAAPPPCAARPLAAQETQPLQPRRPSFAPPSPPLPSFRPRRPLQVCFWSTQVLTWLVLPFLQVYADAGDFTVGARCKTSLRVRPAGPRRCGAPAPLDRR